MPERFPDAESVMRRAIELARRGEGSVEPNPMVGAVIVDAERNLLGEGWHERFGGPHAEINALKQAGERARGATIFVTLEPCAHHGKTPPCVDALAAAGIARVVIGTADPAPHTGGRGVAALRTHRIDVSTGLLPEESSRLIAPFRKLMTTGRPYVLAKWAMSLDGKIATSTGDSKWISNEQSRARAHELRGRVDAVIVGSGTAAADDPLLTARPAGPRVATRIVVDSRGALSAESQLIKSAKEAPVIVAVGAAASDTNLLRFEQAGVEVLRLPLSTPLSESVERDRVDLPALLEELGRRQMTNVLVEGGSRLLGSLIDARLVDEVHVFIAPRVIGGSNAVPAVGGIGASEVVSLPRIAQPEIEILDGDVYIHGAIREANSK